jgi:hypothetical protein
MDKIEDGEIYVQNPVYKKNSMRIDLTPESVEWIVFWSRNYTNLLNNRSFFERFRLFFHFTIISHHPMLEKVNLPQRKVIRQMESLVYHYGSDHIIWRYDPIVCWQNGKKVSSNYNRSDFKLYCREFSALGLQQCYFSYITDYAKIKTRLRKKYPNLKILSTDDSIVCDIIEDMRNISSDSGINLYSCCNDALIGFNTCKGHCISGSQLNDLSGKKIVSEAKSATRLDCGCTRSVDIGSYINHPCYFGCIYCYANPVWE